MGSSLSVHSEAQKSVRLPKPQTNPAVYEAVIDDGFGQPHRDPEARDDSHSFPLDKVDLSSISNEQLAHLFFTAPKIHQYGAVTVVRLSKSIAVKAGRGVFQRESQTMAFAAETLYLPVPKVHRTFRADVPGIDEGELTEGQFIVMDYIPGPTVDECWDTLDLSQRQSVASQVAAMINTMQAATLKLPPGPIGRTKGEKFEGPWFTEYGAGPFATLQDLENWCNHKIDVCKKFNQLPPRTKRFKFRRLVLTHQDIAPRNLILDAQGKVWMVDWGLAGVYPPGFEQAAFESQWKWYDGFSEMVLARLSDRQEKVVEQYRAIAYGLSLAARH